MPSKVSPPKMEANEPQMISMPSHEIIDLVPHKWWLQYSPVGSIQALVELCENPRLSAYFAEAQIYRTIAALGLQRADLDEHPIGIHPKHKLRTLRSHYWANWQGQEAAPEPVALILWGARSNSGTEVFRDGGTLLRDYGLVLHLASYPDRYGHMDILDLLLAWARASGVSHSKTLNALERLVLHHMLIQRRPALLYATLAASEMEYARQVAGPDPRRAYAFFRCLQRIAAWSFRGRVCWRSAWLRGTGQSEDAIPGASTYSRTLTALLNEHVFTMEKGWSAGRAAARYRLKREIEPGLYGPKDFASKVGLELTDNLAPKKF